MWDGSVPVIAFLSPIKALFASHLPAISRDAL
jgi:hypothetical protein